ncbi:CotS family spore coat protein [Paenibacillus alvei]|nr:CotS family spore coat protein [Paenibacillus alvei]NEZ41254.1 CotS family spore coat protein [Paenibacillus alvei]
MDPIQIQPWEHLIDAVPPGTNLEQYVPPEVEETARHVMAKYDMQVSSMVLITSKPDKGGAIWRIETNHGSRSLKVLHRTPARSLFSIGAQQYLVDQGARVPALISTLENKVYVEAGGKLWIVTDWIEQMQPVSKIDLEGAAALCYGLGEFHRFSKGYVPPAGAGKSSRLYTWPDYYEKIIAKIGWFRDIASAYREFPVSQQLLDVVDEFQNQAKETLERLLNVSKYTNMVAMGEPYWGLVHQDYGWSNGQMGPGGIWVIDLDGVAYDLPFRDLRKLITSTMDDMGYWDTTWIRGMIRAYHEANPMDREMFELLCLDMAFPNEFYKHVKEIVFDPTTFMSTELEGVLQRVLATESTKWQALKELASDIENYAPGDYASGEFVYNAVPSISIQPVSAPALHPNGKPATDTISNIISDSDIVDRSDATASNPTAAAADSAPEAIFDRKRSSKTIRRKRRRTRRHSTNRALSRKKLVLRRKRKRKSSSQRTISIVGRKKRLFRSLVSRKKRSLRSAKLRKNRKKLRFRKTG